MHSIVPNLRTAENRLADARPCARRRLFSCLSLLLALGLGPACKSKDSSAPADAVMSRPVPVLLAPVARRDLPIYLDGLGTVTAFKTVTVRTQVDGRLEKVLFREGQRVSRGELLAQVDPRPFLATLHQAESALARDEALLANARKNLQRYKDLRTQNLLSQQQLDDQQALVSQYEGSVGVDRAAAEAARLNVEYSRIVAPIDGVTGVRLIDEGNLVQKSDATGLVVITQIDPITVLFTLPEDDLPKIIAQLPPNQTAPSAKTEPGTAAEKAPTTPKGQPVEAWSRDGTTKLGVGELLVLDNQIQQGTATLRLKAVFGNPHRQLWPNQFVKARLLLSTQHDALVVPAVAVQRGPKGTFVYVVGDEGTANPRPVDVALLTGDQAVLAKGVKPGEQIVIEGQNQLRPGAKVSARPAAGGSADRSDGERDKTGRGGGHKP